MLLNGHNLDAVITISSYAGQDVIAELGVCTHALFVLGHTDVALIDEQRICGGLELLNLPLVSIFRRPNLSREDVSLLVLNNTCCPSRNAFSLSAFPMHDELVEGTMLEALVLDLDFPAAIAALDALHLITRTLRPLVEVADNIDFCCIRSPFAQHIAIFCLVESKIEIAAGKLAEIVCTSCEFSHLADSLLMTSVDGICEVLQAAVVSDETQHCRFLNNLFNLSLCRRLFLCCFLCFL